MLPGHWAREASALSPREWLRERCDEGDQYLRREDVPSGKVVQKAVCPQRGCLVRRQITATQRLEHDVRHHGITRNGRMHVVEAGKAAIETVGAKSIETETTNRVKLSHDPFDCVA